MAKKKAKKKKEIVKKELTVQEKQRLDKYRQRKKNKSVKFKISKDSSVDKPKIEAIDLDDSLGPTKMTEALGTPDSDLQSFMLNQVLLTFKGAASSNGQNQEKSVESCNNALVILSGIQPQDEIEGMLAVQMIGVHNMAMETMRLAILDGQTFMGKQSNVNYAAKMLRTFMLQVDTLKKYRSNNQQKMVVGQVNVNDGGKAIVGTVNQGKDESGEPEGSSSQ